MTVYPIVCYYKCNEEEHTHLVQEALVFLFDDLTHDSQAVHHFESLAVKLLQEKRGLNCQHIVEFTDGCSGQYKSKSPFADNSYTKLTHGISFERNFFGSRHGKGPSDGVSGVVKSAVRRAVISRRVTINTAEEMFDYDLQGAIVINNFFSLISNVKLQTLPCQMVSERISLLSGKVARVGGTSVPVTPTRPTASVTVPNGMTGFYV